MSKRGGKTSPIGSPDQDAPVAPPPSAGNPVEGIQPEDSMDPVANQGDVTEKLKDEIEAHSKTKSMAKKREAEFKIFEQAITEKLRDITEKLRDVTEKHRDATEKLSDVTEKLKDEIEAHGRTESMAKKREAEFKIFEQAETGHELRAKDLLASLDSSERERELEAKRWLHARKLIVALEDVHWERATSQKCHDADGWREWVQKYEVAMKPLVRQTHA